MHRNLPAVFVITGTNNIRAAAYHGGKMELDLGPNHRDDVPGLRGQTAPELHAVDQVGPASTEPSQSSTPPTTTPPVKGETTALVQINQEKASCCHKCRVNKELLPNKFLYFSFAGGLGCAMPYVAIYLKQLGLSPQQIGLISGMKPIVGFVSGPLWGAIGDRFRIQRWLLLVSIVAWLGFYLGLFFMPSPHRLDACPALKPHRRHLTRREASWDLNATTSAPTNMTRFETRPPVVTTDQSGPSSDEQKVLRESLGWLYESREVTRVFVTALALIVGGELVQSPTSSLSDAVTLHTLGSDRLEHYGAQRAWGAVGWACASLLGGGIISSSRKPEVVCGVDLHFSDYKIIAYVFIGFMALTFIAAYFIKFKDHTEETSTVEINESSPSVFQAVDSPDIKTRKVHVHSTWAVIRLFRNVHYGSWLCTAFAVGCFNGIIWGFLYWHLENLGADQMMMAADSVVMYIAEFGTFFCVGNIIRWVGHMGVMYIGLIGYSIRFCVYAVITNPWWALPADMLQGITFSSVWVSLTSYTAISVPAVSLGTMQGILHGVYFGLGTGTGHLLGGLMIGYLGAQTTFLSFAAASALVLILFIICQKCSRKPENIQFEYKDIDDSTV